jgi:WD40 repeat protein
MIISKGRFWLGVLLASLAAAGQEGPAQPTTDKQPPARTDCYGDPLPEGAVGRLGTLRFRFPWRVNDLAFTPDGKTLLSVCSNGTVLLWDASTGKEIRRLQPPADALSRKGNVDFGGIGLSPDGKTVIGLAPDGAVHVWDLATGKEVRRLRGGKGFGLALSGDGKALAVGEEAEKPGRQIALWDLTTGKPVRELGMKAPHVRALAFSADGRLLAAGGGYNSDAAENDNIRVGLWDLATGRPLRTMEGHTGGITAIAFSPDGRRLASCSHDSTVRLWETATGMQVRILRVRDDSPGVSGPVGTKGLSLGGVLTIAFSPDGKLLATGSADGTVRFWDPDSGEELHILRGHGGEVTKVVFSRDGKVLASASRDHTIRLWDPVSGKHLQARPGQDGAVGGLAVSGDGQLVAALGKDRRIRLWSALTRRQLHLLPRHKEDISSAAFTPDGQLFASADLGGDVRLWDTATGKEQSGRGEFVAPVDSVAFSSANLLLWSGASSLVFWDVSAERIVDQIAGEGGSMRRVQTSFDGKVAAARDEDCLLVWDVATRKKRQRIAGVFAAHALSPDGRLLATCSQQENGIRLWNVADGEQRGVLANQVSPEDRPALFPFVLSPDCRLLARPSKDNTLQLWETASGKVRRQLRGHLAAVGPVAFSPDGLLLYSGSHDTTVLVWDVARRHEQYPARLSEAQLQGFWRDLAGEDGERVDRAICTLVVRPEQSVPFLAQRLKPARPPDGKLLARLIADLDSDDFAVRQKANEDLEQLRELAKPALRQALKQSPSLEVRRRIQRLLPRPPGPLPAGDRLRELRAVEVLERVGTPEARRLLQRLTEGAPESWLTQEAKAALERLGSQPIARP